MLLQMKFCAFMHSLIKPIIIFLFVEENAIGFNGCWHKSGNACFSLLLERASKGSLRLISYILDIAVCNYFEYL